MQHHTRFLYPVAFWYNNTTEVSIRPSQLHINLTTSMFRHYRSINPSLLYLFRVIFFEAGIAPGNLQPDRSQSC